MRRPFQVGFVTLGCILSLAASMDSGFAAETCAAATEQEKEDAARFVTKHFGFAESTQLYVAGTKQIPNSCYTRLIMKVKGTDQNVAQDFYLSPDRRFLSLTLFDLDLFRPEAERTIEKRLKIEAERQSVPVWGQRNAKILISVFSDFQCPYCRETQTVIDKDIIGQYGNRAAIAFHQYPLPNHNWANKAAMVLSCVNNQSPTAFWKMARWLFEHQSAISDKNVEHELFAKSYELGHIASNELMDCMASRRGTDQVERDKALANDLLVTSTPTIFIGGQRLDGAVSASVMRRAIALQLRYGRQSDAGPDNRDGPMPR